MTSMQDNGAEMFHAYEYLDNLMDRMGRYKDTDPNEWAPHAFVYGREFRYSEEEEQYTFLVVRVFEENITADDLMNDVNENLGGYFAIKDLDETLFTDEERTLLEDGVDYGHFGVPGNEEEDEERMK